MQAFAVLADPSRRRIVQLLAGGGRTVGQIHGEFSMSQPAISQHLKVLKDAGMVDVRVDAQRRIYSLNQEPIEEAMRWMAQVRAMWTANLDAMELALQDEIQ